ncbi:MAG: TolC family protein [Rhodoferax sp.]|nr:TolC family protein [Rhodoferax sp.]
MKNGFYSMAMAMALAAARNLATAVGLATLCGLVQAQSLVELLQRTLQTHPAVMGQQSQRAVSAAELEFAHQQFYPTPSVSIEQVNAGSQDPSYLQSTTVKLFRLQQPLWTHGRLTAGVQKATANVEVSANGFDDIRQQLALRVIQSWADAYAADLKQVALQASVLTHERLQGQVTRRIAEGASAATERVLTDGRLAQTRAQLQSVAVQAETARLRLQQLAGATENMILQAETERVLVTESAAAALDAAKQRSPAIRRLRATVAVQEADVLERKADLLPELYARAEYQIGSTSISGAPDSQRIFVGLQSKFGAGLSSLAGVEASQGKVGVARAEVESAERTLAEQVLSDWAQIATLKVRQTELEESLQASRETAQAWDRQFLAGRKTWVEVMNMARELAQAETELADVRAVRVLVSWRLALYTQGLDGLLGGISTP